MMGKGESQTVFNNRESRQFCAYNCLFNGVIAGIGSGVHHKKGEKFFHAAKNGFMKGLLSGACDFESKQILSNNVNQNKMVLNPTVFWGSKLLNAGGNSLLRAGTLNEKVKDNLYMEIGFLRISNRGVQIEPISFGCLIYNFVIGDKFDYKTSLICGTPIFTYGYNKLISNDYEIYGYEMNMNISYYNKYIGNDIFMHEICHNYQTLSWENTSNLFKIYDKYENVGIIHNDLSLYTLVYDCQNYNHNIFETEANWFAKENNDVKDVTFESIETGTHNPNTIPLIIPHHH